MMYFGSIRFYKHLVICLLCLMVIIPVIIAVSLLLKSNKLTAELNTVKALAEKGEQSGDLVEINNKPTQELVVHEDEPVKEVVAEAINYQLDYPDLYVTPTSKAVSDSQKLVYLTFDDGPSKHTQTVLDILDEHQIKATFFVVYKNDAFSNSMYKEIVERGHTIGVHSASHQYKQIYASVDSYLADFNKMFNHIYEQTGVKPELFRFPGGSINGYNEGLYQELIAEMLRRGFTYHDWNVSSDDASTKATADSIYRSVINGVAKKDKSVVLMHDSSGKDETVQVLSRIIGELKADGYSFEKLDAAVAPCLFSYKTQL